MVRFHVDSDTGAPVAGHDTVRDEFEHEQQHGLSATSIGLGTVVLKHKTVGEGTLGAFQGTG